MGQSRIQTFSEVFITLSEECTTMSKYKSLLLFIVVVAVMPAVPSFGAKFRNPPAKSAIDDEDFVMLCQSGTVQEIITAIKSRGANVNAIGTIILEVKGKKYDNKVSALMSACLGNNAEAVSILLRSGANISTRVNIDTIGIGYDSADVLCFASAFCKNPKIINMLIKAGANVNSRMEDGMTALIWAAKEGASPEIIQTLIKAGANINAKNIFGMTALKFASGLNAKLVIVNMLLEAGADINAGKGNRTALMQAAGFSNDPEIVNALIRAGADVNAKGEQGMTALMCAAAWLNENPEIINSLIEAGADDVLDINGRSALMYAVERSDNPEIVSALIEAGSFVNIKDKKGNTPLKLAKARIDSEVARKIISLLQQAGAKE